MIDIGDELEQEIIAWLEGHPESGLNLDQLAKDLLADWLLLQEAHERRAMEQASEREEVDTAAS